MMLRAEAEAIEKRLTGGHPNSLGNTIEVVEDVLADSQLVAPLLETYASEDEVVRLRVSSAVKRVTEVHPEWMLPHVGRLHGESRRLIRRRPNGPSPSSSSLYGI